MRQGEFKFLYNSDTKEVQIFIIFATKWLYAHGWLVIFINGMIYARSIVLYLFSLFSRKNRTSARGFGFSISSPRHLPVVMLTL